MKNKTFIALISVLLGLAVFVIAVEFIQRASRKEPTGNVTVLTWNDLYELDLKNNIIPDKLKKLDGTRVRIAGYVVPLSDDYFVLNESFEIFIRIVEVNSGN